MLVHCGHVQRLTGPLVTVGRGIFSLRPASLTGVAPGESTSALGCRYTMTEQHDEWIGAAFRRGDRLWIAPPGSLLPDDDEEPGRPWVLIVDGFADGVISPTGALND